MMETQARFVLIGFFTVLGFLAGLGVLLWLAKVQIDRPMRNMISSSILSRVSVRLATCATTVSMSARC